MPQFDKSPQDPASLRPWVAVLLLLGCLLGVYILWLAWHAMWPLWARGLVALPFALILGSVVWGFLSEVVKGLFSWGGHDSCPGPDYVQRIVTAKHNIYAPNGDWPTKGTPAPHPPSSPSLVFGEGQAELNYWGYSADFVPGADLETIRTFVHQLQPGHEAGFYIPDDLETTVWVRRTDTGMEGKTSHHGCFGTWRATTFEKAIKHLQPGLENLRHPKSEPGACHGVYYIHPDGKKPVATLVWEKVR